MSTRTILSLLLLSLSPLHADPQLSSWYTANSSKYARIVETDGELAAGTSKTTWTRTSGQNTTTQAAPAYAGPQQIDYSASWVYVKTPDLATYLMGPWYDNAARTTLFVNICKNQNITFRIPRTPAITTTRTGTQGLMVGGVLQDAIGFLADGVAVFDPLDGFTYSNGAEAMGGAGQWHRDAYINEGITFDKSYAHQQNTGKYHHHADPIALRYQLGDNVTYNTGTKAYAEGNTAAPARHSPIIGWMLDGLPVYGPYGYGTAMDATSPVRRMIGGFVLRNGQTAGVDTLSSNRALPAWALRNNGNVSAAGPAVSAAYPLSRYIEDWAYLGDLIKAGTTKYAQGTDTDPKDFDLNEYNVRYCRTPEFPNGTWAYFLCISSTGTPQFPYLINRWFYGTPTGGSLTTVAETVTNVFKGGINLTESASLTSVNAGTAQLQWTSVEGGTYKVEAGPDLSNWSTLTSTKAATANSTTTNHTDIAGTETQRRYYKVTRTATAAYDGGAATGNGPPTATTSASTAITNTTATLNGSITANGLSTAVTFEYGTTTGYGTTIAGTPATVTGSTATSIAANITGLTANTLYHFRVKGVNSSGTTNGSDLTFTATTGGGTQGISSITPNSGNRVAGVVTAITLNAAFIPAPPQLGANPTTVTLTRSGAATITGTALSRNATTGVVSATFNLTGATAGATYTVNATFGQNTWSLTDGFTVN